MRAVWPCCRLKIGGGCQILPFFPCEPNALCRACSLGVQRAHQLGSSCTAFIQACGMPTRRHRPRPTKQSVRAKRLAPSPCPPAPAPAPPPHAALRWVDLDLSAKVAGHAVAHGLAANAQRVLQRLLRKLHRPETTASPAQQAVSGASDGTCRIRCARRAWRGRAAKLLADDPWSEMQYAVFTAKYLAMATAYCLMVC